MAAKLARKRLKVFARDAVNNGQFGSGQTGTKITTTDIETIQALTAWLNGWNDAIISGQKLPTLEEMQGIQYVSTYQIAYLLQEGIPEWNTDTEYHQNSVVKKTGTYELYGSINNNNLGNALPAAVTNANWAYLGSLTALSTAGNVSTAETSSVDGQLYVASGVGGKTLKKVASDGYAKQVSTSVTMVSAIPLTDLATQAANTALGNFTGSSAVPTALAYAANQFVARSSSGNAAMKTITDFGLSLVDDANAAAAKTTLGIAKSVSTDITYANAGLVTFAHGLGAIPTWAFVQFVCQTANGNWSVNDVANHHGGVDNDAAPYGVQVYMDSTNIYVRISNSGPGLEDKTTGAFIILNAAQWKIRLTGILL